MHAGFARVPWEAWASCIPLAMGSGVIRGGGQLPPGVGRQNPTNEIIKIYYERNLEEKTERIK